MNPVKYTIRDLERITGIKAHTIRMWEKRYGIISPDRTSTNIRSYSDHHLQKLLNISILNRNGFKISQISGLTESEIIDEVTRISDSPEGMDANINTMIMAAIDLHEEQFEKTLNSSILKLGFESTFCEFVFPLLDKIGVFWQIGRINNCQERFITNLIRQKLLVAIDGLVGQTIPKPRNFLLFLPAGHYKEIGLLFSNYLIRKSGHNLVYLGPSVPLDHLKRMGDESKFTDLVINISVPQDDNDLANYLKELIGIFPSQKIHLIFNAKTEIPNIQNLPNLKVYNSFSNFSSLINLHV